MSQNQKNVEEILSENDGPANVESELHAMREYFAAKGTKNPQMKSDFAFLLLRMILSTPHTVNSTNATAHFLTPFTKFDFDDKLNEILADISEVSVTNKHSGKNIAMKWNNIVEKLEAYLDDQDEDEKDDPLD